MVGPDSTIPLNTSSSFPKYRGRLAPSPTGFLHLGHARTFWVAQQRAVAAGGELILRNDDLDVGRCKGEFVQAMFEDLRWFGLRWQEGPDCGGGHGPYSQSQRIHRHRKALGKLVTSGRVYPCFCSRKDVLAAVRAPHAADDDEPVYPGTCRNNRPSMVSGRKHSWRFRVRDGEEVSFHDGRFGHQRFIAGKDFGDFVVWRPDDLPSYQLATVVDDVEMEVTEVVRGADLLKSTARQLLLYQSLDLTAPSFLHVPLLLDHQGQRLAKRHDALSLRSLRAAGRHPDDLRQEWGGG